MTAADGYRPRIVVFEDDLFFSVRIDEGLRRAGYEVRLVRDEQRFREELAEGRPDLFVVHTSVRSVDWERLLREARANPETAGVPVLAFGSHMDLEQRRRALAAGADQVVANSKFVGDMAGLVGKLVKPAQTRI